MTTQMQPIRQQARGQVRGFVVIWTFITLIMGLATFLAIFFAARQPLPEETPLGQFGGGGDPVVVISSQTPLPTLPPTATLIPAATNTTAVQPTQVAQVNTEAPTETPAPTNTPPPLPDEDDVFQVGVQVQVPQDLDAGLLGGYYRNVGDLGVNWVKQQVRWEVVEPEQGQYDWGELDLIFSQSLYWRINVMLSIVTAPEWAREQGVNVDRHGPARTNDLYVNFVRAILERYPGQVFAIEVWNEQNLDREWTSLRGLSASNYVSLLRDTYNMVQEVSSGTIVISGALSPTGLDDGIGAIDDFRYMDQMINAGMLDVTDCVGAHHNGYNIGPTVVYTNVPNDPTAIFRGPFDNPHHSWSFRSTLEGYTQRIRAAGSDKKLCVTEFGWAVTEDLDGTPRGFEFADDNSLEEQAQFFADALEYMEGGGNVWLAFIWNLNYGPQANWDPTNDNTPYSLIGPGFEFRPAFDAIREWYAAYEQRIGRS
jgi:hypothetical protein